MVAVPADTPVTTPVELMLATKLLLLPHTPPLTPSVRVVVAPVHTVDEPDMVPAVTIALTVTGSVALVVPQLLVTV